jgi:hypothetical protein
MGGKGGRAEKGKGRRGKGREGRGGWGKGEVNPPHQQILDPPLITPDVEIACHDERRGQDGHSIEDVG